MFRESRFHPWLLTLLCVALLVVRVGGAHLHLCFDGGEPPVSLHLMDDAAHTGPGMQSGHQDMDVALAGEAFAKTAKLGLDLPILLIAALLAWSLFQAPRPSVPGYRLPLISAVHFLRPPLRGPPPLTSR